MPAHRHRRGTPDGGLVHMGQARGALINAHHERVLAESTGERAVIHQVIPEVGGVALQAASIEIDFEDDTIFDRGRE